MPAADPYSAAFGAAANVVGKAVTAPPAGPSDARSGTTGGSNFDNSGWNVTFGNNSGVTSDRNQAAPASLTQAAAGLLGGNNVMYIMGALVLWKMLKKRG